MTLAMKILVRPAASPCGVSRAVHPASSVAVPPLRPAAGAAASSHVLPPLLRAQPALQAALRTHPPAARGEPLFIVNYPTAVVLTLLPCHGARAPL